MASFFGSDSHREDGFGELEEIIFLDTTPLQDSDITEYPTTTATPSILSFANAQPVHFTTNIIESNQPGIYIQKNKVKDESSANASELTEHIQKYTELTYDNKKDLIGKCLHLWMKEGDSYVELPFTYKLALIERKIYLYPLIEKEKKQAKTLLKKLVSSSHNNHITSLKKASLKVKQNIEKDQATEMSKILNSNLSNLYINVTEDRECQDKSEELLSFIQSSSSLPSRSRRRGGKKTIKKSVKKNKEKRLRKKETKRRKQN